MSLKGKVHELEAKVHDAKSQHGTAQAQIDATTLPDAEVFRQLGTHFQNWGSQQQDHLQQLDNGHSALKASWQGDGAETYSTMHTQMKSVGDQHLEHHQQASTQFNQAADETETVNHLLKEAAKDGAKVAGFATAAAVSVGLALATFWVPIEGEVAVGAAVVSVGLLLGAIGALVNTVQALIAAVHGLTSLVKAIFGSLHGLLPGRGGKPQNPPAAPPSDGNGKYKGGGRIVGGGNVVWGPNTGTGGGRRKGGSSGSGSGSSGGGSGRGSGGGGGRGSGGSGGSGRGSGRGSGSGTINLGNDTYAVTSWLQQTPQGRHALSVQQTYHVTIVYGSLGGGTYYEPSTNTVYIDPSSSYNADTSIIHEMTHAEHYNTGSMPNAMTLSRNDFVAASVHEEADAMYNEIVYEIAAQDVRPARPVDPLTSLRNILNNVLRHDPVYDLSYDRAYSRAYQRAFNNAVGSTSYREGRARAIAQQQASLTALQDVSDTARRTLYDALAQGRVVGSQTGTTYPQQFSYLWDQLHQGTESPMHID